MQENFEGNFDPHTDTFLAIEKLCLTIKFFLVYKKVNNSSARYRKQRKAKKSSGKVSGSF